MSEINVAVVDDDPVELVLLKEMATEVVGHVSMRGFDKIEHFLDEDINAFDVVFLDRRMPPYRDYTDTLPMLAAAGYRNRVILMTAHDPGLEVGTHEFRISGPIDKLDLLKPEIFGAVIRDEPVPLNSWTARI